MEFIQLFSAAGIGGVVGSLLTAVVQAYFLNKSTQKTRSFNEKKEAYAGLLEAYHRAAVEGTDSAAKNFGYWQMRCELVAPEIVRIAIQKIVDTNDDKDARPIAHEHLKAALRRDLGIELR